MSVDPRLKEGMVLWCGEVKPGYYKYIKYGREGYGKDGSCSIYAMAVPWLKLLGIKITHENVSTAAAVGCVTYEGKYPVHSVVKQILQERQNEDYLFTLHSFNEFGVKK